MKDYKEIIDTFNNIDISENSSITKEFILEYKDKNWNLFKILEKFKDITFEEISEFKSIDTNFINKYYKENLNWEYILKNTDIIIEKNKCSSELKRLYKDRFAKKYYVIYMKDLFVFDEPYITTKEEFGNSIYWNHEYVCKIPFYDHESYDFNNMYVDRPGRDRLYIKKRSNGKLFLD